MLMHVEHFFWSKILLCPIPVKCLRFNVFTMYGRVNLFSVRPEGGDALILTNVGARDMEGYLTFNAVY